MSEEVLFRSKRYMDYPYLIVLALFGTLIIFFFFKTNFHAYQKYSNKSSIVLVDNSDEIDKETNLIYNNIILLDSTNVKNNVNDTILYKAIQQIAKDNYRRSVQTSKNQDIGILIFLNIIMLLSLYTLIKLMIDYFYKYKASFIVTKDYISISRFRKKEKILLKDIETISLLGKQNLVGYLSNKDLSAIIINTKNGIENNYIPTNRYTYTNLPDLLRVLKSIMPEKVVINKIKVDQTKIIYFYLFGLAFSIYIVVKIIIKGEYYYLAVILVLSFVIAKIFKRKRNINYCPELFEDF